MTADDALQRTLEAEHAAVHVLSTLAGISRALDTDPTDTGLDVRIGVLHQVHRARREHLLVLLRSAGATPPAALPAYELPAHETRAEVERSVLDVEEGCLAHYSALVAESSAEVRAWAVTALQESAIATVGWGAEPSSFPGAPELATP